jgi:hypothetical protein
MQAYRSLIAINLVVLAILCAVVVRFAGSHFGAAQATAVTADDATAKPTAGSAVAAPVDDGVSGRAIAGSPDIFLHFAGDTVKVTPFIRDFRAEDTARNLVEKHESECDNEGELYDGATSQVWAVSITTDAVFEVEQLYWDAQNGRLVVKAINKPGEPASWGHFCMSGHFVSELEQANRLEFIAGDKVRRIFVLAGSPESSGVD